MDATSFGGVLFAGRMGVVNWMPPHESLTADGCMLNYVHDADSVASVGAANWDEQNV
jgi:hypothetical protein